MLSGQLGLTTPVFSVEPWLAAARQVYVITLCFPLKLVKLVVSGDTRAIRGVPVWMPSRAYASGFYLRVM